MANELTVVTADISPLIETVTNTVASHATRRNYARALRDFFAWLRENPRNFDRATVQAYVAHLQAEGLGGYNINQRLVPIRKLAEEANYAGSLDQATTAGIRAVRGIKVNGSKIGNWLTLEGARELVARPDTETLAGKRDRAALVLLVTAGLRREELVSLTIEHIQKRDGRWVILDLVGKRNKTRTVPITADAKGIIDEWAKAAGITDGPVFRTIRKGGHVGGQMTPQTVYNIVAKYTDVSPHDLRRTAARLWHQAGAPLEQISLMLGHDSIKTTQRYLGIEQDLVAAPCDYVPSLV